MQAPRLTLTILMLSMALLVLTKVTIANGIKVESEEQAAVKALNKLVGSSLARFLFYSALHSDQQAASGLKRSSSALDPLSGFTIGKRFEQVNLEPYFGRQFALRSSPASTVEPRWVPLESYERAYSSQLDY